MCLAGSVSGGSILVPCSEVGCTLAGTCHYGINADNQQIAMCVCNQTTGYTNDDWTAPQPEGSCTSIISCDGIQIMGSPYSQRICNGFGNCINNSTHRGVCINCAVGWTGDYCNQGTCLVDPSLGPGGVNNYTTFLTLQDALQKCPAFPVLTIEVRAGATVYERTVNNTVVTIKPYLWTINGVDNWGASRKYRNIIIRPTADYYSDSTLRKPMIVANGFLVDVSDSTRTSDMYDSGVIIEDIEFRTPQAAVFSYNSFSVEEGRVDTLFRVTSYVPVRLDGVTLRSVGDVPQGVTTPGPEFRAEANKLLSVQLLGDRSWLNMQNLQLIGAHQVGMDVLAFAGNKWGGAQVIQGGSDSMGAMLRGSYMNLRGIVRAQVTAGQCTLLCGGLTNDYTVPSGVVHVEMAQQATNLNVFRYPTLFSVNLQIENLVLSVSHPAA